MNTGEACRRSTHLCGRCAACVSSAMQKGDTSRCFVSSGGETGQRTSSMFLQYSGQPLTLKTLFKVEHKSGGKIFLNPMMFSSLRGKLNGWCVCEICFFNSWYLWTLDEYSQISMDCSGC